MKWFFVLVMFIASSVNAQYRTDMETNYRGLRVTRPATAVDGYDGGVAVIRDAFSTVGGTPGYVNAANFARTISGVKELQFEWTTLSIMDNFAERGENVAGYFQGNKYNSGPTWGLVTEVADYSGNPSGTVGQEVDVWIIGKDTGNRIGVDVVAGDLNRIRYGKPSPIAEASVGVRVGSNFSSWSRGFQVTGVAGIGVDTSRAVTKEAVRIGEGQAVTFDGKGAVQMLYQGGRMAIKYNGVAVFELDVVTGDIYKNGRKVL